MDTAALEPFRRAVVTSALGFRGRRYCFGGRGPECFDCSGFVGEVLRKQGLAIPRTAADIAKFQKFEDIPSSEVRPGDLVFFDLSGRGTPDHVGIVLPDARMIHASTSRGVVIDKLSDPPFSIGVLFFRSIDAK